MVLTMMTKLTKMELEHDWEVCLVIIRPKWWLLLTKEEKMKLLTMMTKSMRRNA